MTKRTMIGLVVLLFTLLIGLVIGALWFIQPKLSTPQNQTNQICGGIAGIHCPAGYTCSYPTNTNYPDAAGRCVPK